MRHFPDRLAFRLALPFRALSVGVRALVEDSRGRILLVKHSYVAGWHFPGGGVEPGETAAAATVREVEEETGIRLAGPLALLGVYLNRRMFSRDHVLLFRCDRWDRAADFRPGLEIVDCDFFAVDDLPSDLSRGSANRIGEVYSGRPAAEEW